MGFAIGVCSMMFVNVDKEVKQVKETESVKFSAGKEASYLRPGDVVKIIDKNKVNKLEKREK